MDGRIIHSLTVSNTEGKFWTNVYTRVKNHPSGIPFNILLTYFYIKSVASSSGGFKEQVKIVENHRNLVGDGMILIDSGIYTFKAQLGMKTYVGISDTLRKQAIEKGLENLEMFEEWVDLYAQFLKISSDYWDFAIDFDADPILGCSIADRMHERLLAVSGIDKSRIVRVHHVARHNVGDWWKSLCSNPDFSYVAIEAGAQHGNRPEYFSPLIDTAHRYGKQVHVLGVSSSKFLREVPVNTVDSTTHLMGGKFGYLETPVGKLSFARNSNSSDHISRVSPATLEYLTNYWNSEYNLTVEELMGSPYTRNLVNIWHMNQYWDIPYVARDKPIPLFDILGI